jgi:hypothetical protein
MEIPELDRVRSIWLKTGRFLYNIDACVQIGDCLLVRAGGPFDGEPVQDYVIPLHAVSEILLNEKGRPEDDITMSDEQAQVPEQCPKCFAGLDFVCRNGIAHYQCGAWLSSDGNLYRWIECYRNENSLLEAKCAAYEAELAALRREKEQSNV